MQKKEMIQYICSYCGMKSPLKGENQGRPDPGTCTRKGKTADGRTRPHSWRINKRI